MPLSSSNAQASSKKRKELIDEYGNISDGSDNKPSYEELEMKIVQLEMKIARLEQANEDLKGKNSCSNDNDMSDGEIEELDGSDPWIAMYLQLRDYRILNGHCNVPMKSGSLGIWVNNQKMKYKLFKEHKKCSMTQERITMLEGLGMNWGKKFDPPVPWEARLAELEKHKKAFGNCIIRVNSKNPSPLAMWVSAQRAEGKRKRHGLDSLLTLEQVEQLNRIGFPWKDPAV